MAIPFDLMQSAVAALLILDRSGNVLAASRGWSEILGWPEVSILEGNFVAMCRSDATETVGDAIRSAADGTTESFEAWVTHPAGHQVMLSCRAGPAEGGVVLHAEDATLRQALQESDDKLRSLVDYAAEAWFVHDMEGQIVDINRFACESLGYTREQAMSMKIADFEMTIQPGRLDGVWKRMKIGVPVTVEGRHRTIDGREFPVEVRLGLFEVGHEVLMLALARDITERKEVERRLNDLNLALEGQVRARTEELREAYGRLNAILGNLADGLIAVDDEGMFTAVNPAMVKMFGWPNLHFDGAPSAAHLSPEMQELMAACLASGDVSSLEVALPGDRIGMAIASPITSGRKTLGCVVLTRDITLEKEIDRMKTDFIATVSHELRTPLTSVLGFAKLTRTKLDDTIVPALPSDDRRIMRAAKRALANLEIIILEGSRLSALVSDVLDISKMESGRMEWRSDSVDPSGLVTRALASTRSLYLGTRVAVGTELDANLPVIDGDGDRLLQVLINLLSNAVKFTDQGSVTVGVCRAGSMVEFRVTDTGEGIEAAEHDAIFERFRQVGDTLTEKPQGTGLGLSISKYIIEHHGGRIWVQSQPGVGSTFRFTVPITGSPAKAAPKSAVLRRTPVTAPREGRKSDILVVDDDPNVRELLRQELGAAGFDVRLASNGFEALGHVQNRRPDLIVLDVMMPEISGFTVAAKLKGNPETAGVPILALTIVEDTAERVRIGIDGYLGKPIGSDVLLAEVRSLLGIEAP